MTTGCTPSKEDGRGAAMKMSETMVRVGVCAGLLALAGIAQADAPSAPTRKPKAQVTMIASPSSVATTPPRGAPTGKTRRTPALEAAVLADAKQQVTARFGGNLSLGSTGLPAPLTLDLQNFSASSGSVLAAMSVGQGWVSACPPGLATGVGCGIVLDPGASALMTYGGMTKGALYVIDFSVSYLGSAQVWVGDESTTVTMTPTNDHVLLGFQAPSNLFWVMITGKPVSDVQPQNWYLNGVTLHSVN
jgi:hypothetical protein